VAEEDREAVRDRVVAVAGGVRVDRLREALPALAYARNVGIASRMSEACPARR
jgi:hypothetical protein